MSVRSGCSRRRLCRQLGLRQAAVARGGIPGASREELKRWPTVVSSALLVVEVHRACARYPAPATARADADLSAVLRLPIDEEILTAAARLQPAGLRSLDAIHVATALSLGTDLGVLVAYDERFLEAAEACGLETISP